MSLSWRGCSQVELGTPAEKPEKGEDWEHEEERQDDDLEQGDEEGSDQDQNTAIKKCPSLLWFKAF